jgi:hypothetical protein
VNSMIEAPLHVMTLLLKNSDRPTKKLRLFSEVCRKLGICWPKMQTSKTEYSRVHA